jgi:hypothetical protein
MDDLLPIVEVVILMFMVLGLVMWFGRGGTCDDK